jgi:hypothetical protein
MAGRLVPARIGDIDVLIEVVPQAGTEPTVGLKQASRQVGDAFARAQETIVEIAKSTTEVIEKAAARAARPDRFEVEFGLKFSASGGIIVAGASGEASLKVTLTYDSKREPAGPTPSANDPEQYILPLSRAFLEAGGDPERLREILRDRPGHDPA